MKNLFPGINQNHDLLPIQNVEKSVFKLHFLEYCFQLAITLENIVSKTLFLRCKLTFLLFDLDILLDY